MTNIKLLKNAKRNNHNKNPSKIISVENIIPLHPLPLTTGISNSTKYKTSAFFCPPIAAIQCIAISRSPLAAVISWPHLLNVEKTAKKNVEKTAKKKRRKDSMNKQTMPCILVRRKTAGKRALESTIYKRRMLAFLFVEEGNFISVRHIISTIKNLGSKQNRLSTIYYSSAFTVSWT